MSPELLGELRLWVQLLGLSKLEVFGIFVVCLLAWRLPLIMKHSNERYAIKKDFEAKAKRLGTKIEQEQLRRLERSKRREKS